MTECTHQQILTMCKCQMDRKIQEARQEERNRAKEIIDSFPLHPLFRDKICWEISNEWCKEAIKKLNS